MITTKIITTEQVDTTFDGMPCLLQREIVQTVKRNGKKAYIIETTRCNYTDVQQPVLDENDEPILDKDGNAIMETVSVLQKISVKDSKSVREYTFDEINGLYDSIKDQVPSGLSKMDSENMEEKIALLVITKQDQVWGIRADKWDLLTD